MNAYEDHTLEEIDAMRTQLAEAEWEDLTVKDLKQCLWHGVRGWENIPSTEIIDLHDSEKQEGNQ